ncbi:MAG: hypothetical protein ABR908_17070, partial [Terriglobales bacterium]
MTKLRLALPALFVFLFAATLWGRDQQPQIRIGYWRGMRVTYTWVPGKDGKGKAIFEGDILLDNLEESPNSPRSLSLGVAYSSYLWPAVDGLVSI